MIKAKNKNRKRSRPTSDVVLATAVIVVSNIGLVIGLVLIWAIMTQRM